MLIRAASLSLWNTLELLDFWREVVWGVARQQVAVCSRKPPKVLVIAVKVQVRCHFLQHYSLKGSHWEARHNTIYAESEGCFFFLKT